MKMLLNMKWHLGVSLVLASIYNNSARGHSPPSHPESCHDCPRFINMTSSVRTSVGTAVNLTCGVRNLGDSQVSWIRRKDLHVLTTDTMTYTSDVRFRAAHVPGSPFWMLEIDNPQARDEGIYECQVASQPKIYRRFHLKVTVPVARIVGSSEVYMKMGSDINITCVVTGHTPPVNILWFHSTIDSNGDEVKTEIKSSDRGGVQLVTDRKQGTSWLLVDRAAKGDAGNYSCDPPHTIPAYVTVHVIQAEEAPAAMTPELTNTATSTGRSGYWWQQPNPRDCHHFLEPTKCVARGTRRRGANILLNYNNSVSKFRSCSEKKHFWKSCSSSGRICDFACCLFTFLFSTAMGFPFEMWAIVAVGSTANIVIGRNMEHHPVSVVNARLFRRTCTHKRYRMLVKCPKTESVKRKSEIPCDSFMKFIVVFFIIIFTFSKILSYTGIFLSKIHSLFLKIHLQSEENVPKYVDLEILQDC